MSQPDADLEILLKYLKEARGFDFTGYKRSSLARRIGHRISEVGRDGYADYLDYIQVHPDEFTALFNAILINVTGFFRDPPAWDHLSGELGDTVLRDAPVRVWDAGCASGEEAYTIAIMLGERLGLDALRERVKIYATDVDDDSLAHARQGAYAGRDIEAVPPELVDRYFERTGGRFVFRKEIRRSVIFGRNDLVRDAPISRVDLLVCRNTLMYFTAETQAQILRRMHFALAEDGLLFLGRAEMLLSHGHLFQPVDLQRRVFRKVPATSPDTPAYAAAMRTRSVDDLSNPDRLRAEAFMTSPVAQIVVTVDGQLALSNRQADDLFGVSTRDIGRPFRDLDISYRPVELRRHIDQTQMERRTACIEGVDYVRAGGETLRLDIQIDPLLDSESGLLGVTVMFRDVTESHRLRDELESLHRRLQAAYEELQSTNEELETTNEELQSTVEELETTNEELQSTNEELETMNEELHSTNDELQSTNDVLRDTSAQVEAANSFLETVLTTLRAGVAVVDRDLLVRLWNRRAEDMWGLRRDEAVGQHFFNLDIGLPTDQLRPLIRAALAGPGDPVEIRLPAVNRRGRTISVYVVCAPINPGADGGPTGTVLVMEETA